MIRSGLCALWCGLALAQAAEMPKHPTVFVTPEGVARAKRNIEKYGWARETATAIRREADRWLARDDAWLRAVVPKPGAAFAYGLSACPICGSGWGAWGSHGGSFDRPGHITCRKGHTLPDREHPDPGTGYVAPDGRVHYFVGAYNAFVVEALTFQGLENLVYAYTLTGEERYAAKAAVILDALAALYPTTHKGCWDYPANPLSGRMHRPFYQASRVLVHYVDHYDQLFNSKALDQPSVTPGMTRRKNIEDNLLRDGGAYCYEKSKDARLHNGEADYLRGVLAVGACLDIPEYVRWAVDGPTGIKVLLENNIGRDGSYYEITPMYSDHTRELYFTFAEPLFNYRGSVYPKGLNLYQHPKLRQFFEPYNLAFFSAGHMPRFGDAPPDLDKRPVTPRPFDRSDYDFLEKLYNRNGDARSGALLGWLANGKLDELRGLASTGDPSGATIPDRRVQAGMSLYREPGDQLGGSFTDRTWLLFNAGDPPPTNASLPADVRDRLLSSHLLGHKGMGILRTGEGADAQGLILRYGPSLTHGHWDELNINYIARGYELTYDHGYGHTAATQTQVGWARQTASHNLVVVDERPQYAGGTTGGSLHLFAGTPGAQVIEASSEGSYSKQNVSVYRRLAALIGSGPDAYVLDLFRVRGGKQHDWIFHALSPEAKFEGVAMGPEEPGSLAGPEISWSDKQLPDGDLAGHPNAPTWMPPPGNGYGYLARPQRGTPDAGWSADWTIDPAARVRVTMPAAPGTKVLTAVANSLYPHYPKSRYVLARRSGENLASEFVAAIEPHGGAPRVRAVERLPLEGPDGEIAPVAVKVSRADGAVDYVFSAGDAAPRKAGGATVAARFAHARVKNGKLESLTMVGGKEFAGFGWRITPAVERFGGAVGGVDSGNQWFTTSAPLGPDVAGAVIVFSNPLYSRTTAHRITRVEKAGNMRRVYVEGGFKLGIGQVDRVANANTFESSIPHEFVFSDRATGEHGFFAGKRIRTQSGASAVIRSVRAGNPMTLTVDSTAPLKAGERFEYVDVQAGDVFEILPAVWVTPGGAKTTPGVKIEKMK
ncbi:MAG TPA: heparinase II/III family protein [Bryobacteraceae bacterium]|nr:heparinase II/III family protein [Bryobacteraceae bacterium]